MASPAFASLIGQNPGIDQYTKILLHFDNGSLADSSSFARTFTNNSATVSTAQSKFGGSSLLCSGTSQWIDTPDSADFTLGSGDFTVDFWFNRQGGDGTVRYVAGQDNSGGATANISFYIGLTAANVLSASVAVAAVVTTVTGTTTITTTGWNHGAFVRTGNILRLFVNGVQEGGDVAFSSTINDSPNKLAVGRLGEFTSNTWNGYIDEFRLSVGIARWTANFNPPGVPYS